MREAEADLNEHHTPESERQGLQPQSGREALQLQGARHQRADQSAAEAPRPRAGRRRSHGASIIVTLVVALGMLAYVAYIAAAPRSAAQLWSIIGQTWPLVAALIVPYLGARLLVWFALLRQLGITVPWQPLVVAFAAGEMTKSLPAGIYLQTYLLGRMNHLDRHALTRSTMATTAMLGLESALAVPVVVILGIPGAPWVRQTVIAVVLAWIVILALAWALVHYRATHLGPRVAAWRRRLVLLIEDFLKAGGELISWRTTRALLPTAVYMFVYVLYLYAIIKALGIRRVGIVDTMAIYAMLVLAVILIPIPTEIGITEFTGLGALLAYGIPGSTAAVVMLALRAVATGATILTAAITLLVMRRQLAAIDAGGAPAPQARHGGGAAS